MDGLVGQSLVGSLRIRSVYRPGKQRQDTETELERKGSKRKKAEIKGLLKLNNGEQSEAFYSVW